MWRNSRSGGRRQGRHRSLRVWVLRLLEGAPMNGAEIMNAIDQMSHGVWRPSPGSVYPMLETMADEKVISKKEDGRYELTEAGREEMTWPSPNRARSPGSVEDVLKEVANYVSYLEDVAKTDGSKIGEHSQQIGELRARLSRLGGEE